MKKYFLIPFETDAKKMEYDFQPKYLSLFPTDASAIQPKITIKDGKKVFKAKFFIIKWVRENESDYSELLKQSDVIELNKDTDKLELSNIGVDETNITEVDKYEQKDKAVTKWLTDEEFLLSEKL